MRVTELMNVNRQHQIQTVCCVFCTHRITYRYSHSAFCLLHFFALWTICTLFQCFELQLHSLTKFIPCTHTHHPISYNHCTKMQYAANYAHLVSIIISRIWFDCFSFTEFMSTIFISFNHSPPLFIISFPIKFCTQ